LITVGEKTTSFWIARALTADFTLLKMKTAMQQSLSSKLADIMLPDSDGREVRLGSLWAASPAVIVFLRHYG
jgi:hypothetical protein